MKQRSTGPSDSVDPRQAAAEALADFGKQETERLEDQAALTAKQEKRKTLKAIGQWAVIVACLGIIGYQLPGLADALSHREKPLRKGIMATDDLTDQCIATLWKVSKRLQEGKPVGNDLVCPASNKSFVLETIGDDVVARSPAPERYGLREIRVSRKNPVPELIR